MRLCFLLCTACILRTCVISGDLCPRKNVSGAEGGEVVLCVHHEGIRSINWVLYPEGNVIVTTKPGGSIDDDEDVIKQYRGRVRSEADGSLHIYNLSLRDQRIYSADIRRAEDEICVWFNLTVYDSSMIRRYQKDPSTITIIRWALSGIVLLIACCIFIYHIICEVIIPIDGN